MLGKKHDLIIDFLVKYEHLKEFGCILPEPEFSWSVSASDVSYRLMTSSDKKCRDVYNYGCTILFRKEKNSPEGHCIVTSSVIGSELQNEIIGLRGGLHELFL